MNSLRVYAIALSAAVLFSLPAGATAIYNNLTPTSAIAVVSHPSNPGAGKLETEAADDFVLGSQTQINSASFVGMVVPGKNGGAFTISNVVVEIYRVFPFDSNSARVPQVPTRANSPSDVAFTSKNSTAAGELTFTTSVLAGSFTANNSVQSGGIHPSPNQTTGGNGPLTGQEVQFSTNFGTPIDLPAGHYFLVPQVEVSNGADFYWLSASRPISGAGTTPFLPDLQAWTRDANLDPDWLRVGTDIVGGSTPPTFNMAFSLDGTVVPEPTSSALLFSAAALLAFAKTKRRS